MNRNLMWVIVVIAVAAVGFWLYGKSKRDSALPDLAPVGANLIEGLGDYSMPVTAKGPDVQRWFDQGLAMTYGFNHDAAERSFLKAAELDPDCAMCWWGAALVLGPHVNAAMDPINNPKAWDRLQRAERAASGATDKERAFIKALSARYAENPPEVRRPLDEAYEVAMGELAAKYPDDLDVVTLHAESMMDLQPWDYWDATGQPKGHTAGVVSALESVIARDPEHAGALHLYVHAVEASPDPARGVAAADTLRELLPGSGHLVHMPAHIYARVGRWHDAVIANQLAITADDSLSRGLQAGPGRVPARLRAAQPSLPLVRRDDGRLERDRPRSCRPHGRTHERSAAHAHAGLRGDAELLPDAALCRSPIRALGRRHRDAETRGRRAVHAGDVELRPGDGGREPGPDGRREEVPRGPRAGDEEPGHREDAGLGPVLADRRRAGRRAVRRRGNRARGEGL